MSLEVRSRDEAPESTEEETMPEMLEWANDAVRDHFNCMPDSANKMKEIRHLHLLDEEEWGIINWKYAALVLVNLIPSPLQPSTSTLTSMAQRKNPTPRPRQKKTTSAVPTRKQLARGAAEPNWPCASSFLLLPSPPRL